MDFLYALSNIRTPFLDTVFGLVTRLGEETIAIVLLCAVFWCIDKRLAYSAGVAYFISGLTVQGLKISCRIERPWVRDPSFKPVDGAVEAATGYSFPSGHSQSAGAMLGSFGFYTKRRLLSILLFVIALLVGFSRMYLGVHTPADVIVGLTLSLVVSWISVKFIVKEKTTFKREIVTMILLLIFCTAVISLAFILYSSGAIDEHYVSDCCKAVGAGFGFTIGMFIERCYIKFDTKCRNIFMQILKFLLGFAGLLAIKEGLKFAVSGIELAVGAELVVNAVRYFLMILWAIAIYPIIIKKMFSKR